MVEARSTWTYRGTRAGLPSVGVEDIDHTRVALIDWILSMQSKVMILLRAGELREGTDDSRVGTRFANVEKWCFAKNECASR
jgi:hypothetical protein